MAATENWSAAAAMEKIKALQNRGPYVVPVVLEGETLHEGLAFDIDTASFNAFQARALAEPLRLIENGEKFMLKHVKEEQRVELEELLKIIGMSEYILSNLRNEMLKHFGE